MIDDDANMIARKMYEAEVIAFATPIYYYEMSGQMKTMIDRANSLYDSDYKFTDIYMLTTAAEDEPEVPNRAIGGLT
ncbi:flavodoxin family protein, partial [Eggerthella lenta]|uniref:flavodoxin family protein n=1 Tax=Eggerthella lenta TaxID=84112 RepID=UPI00210B9257|nr:NAD(P)H-dependent oxidoreductase [Eggerthella lenta]